MQRERKIWKYCAVSERKQNTSRREIQGLWLWSSMSTDIINAQQVWDWLYAGMTQPVLLQRLWSRYILYPKDKNLMKKSTDPTTKAKSHVGTDCKCRNHLEEILWLDGRKQTTTTKNNDSPISSHFRRDLKALEERSRQNTNAGLTNWKDQ